MTHTNNDGQKVEVIAPVYLLNNGQWERGGIYSATTHNAIHLYDKVNGVFEISGTGFYPASH